MTHLDTPPGVSLAPPLWAISAEHSAAHLIDAARRRVAAEEVAALITVHRPYYAGDPVTASALTLKRLAEAKGMETRLHVGLDGCTLEARVPGVRRGFSASWSRGKAYAAAWIEPAMLYETMHDDRPGPDATIIRNVKGKPKRVADPKRMPRGLDREHETVVASPYGVTIAFAALTARVKGLPDA